MILPTPYTKAESCTDAITQYHPINAILDYYVKSQVPAKYINRHQYQN